MPTVAVRDASLFYEVYGQYGPWILFAHGTAGNALTWWQQIPIFAERCRCVVFEHRGWGRSRVEGDPDPACFADDMLAVLDAVGAERAAVVAQSMSGWPALDIARRAPQRVTHLLLASTLAGLTDDAMLAELAARHQDTRFVPALALAEEFVAREPAHTWLYEAIAGLNPPSAPGILPALLARRCPPLDAPLPMPVVFLAGDADRLFPIDLIRRAQAKLPASALVVVPGTGHSVYWERPATFNAALASLLGLSPPQRCR